MKRTPINIDITSFPAEFHDILAGSVLYDSSCSDAARVYYIDRDCGYFLKRSEKGSLKAEAEMTSWFHTKGLAADVISYISVEYDWMLTERVIGEDCTHAVYLEKPEMLCDMYASLLRQLHETDYSACPVMHRSDDYFAFAEKNYLAGIFDNSISTGKPMFTNLDDAWCFVNDNRKYLKNDTLIHGDYCLPNTILHNWRFSGFIDLGNGGVGDRHIDLFWGAWTLNFNLNTDKFRERFFDAYGRDKIDSDILRIVEATEMFG